MEYGSFQAEEFGDLQRLVDGLFYDRHAIDRLDLIVHCLLYTSDAADEL